MYILAIESSCDDTAAAVTDGRTVAAALTASQVEEHVLYGGVVPEIASRRRGNAPGLRRMPTGGGGMLPGCGECLPAAGECSRTAENAYRRRENAPGLRRMPTGGGERPRIMENAYWQRENAPGLWEDTPGQR